MITWITADQLREANACEEQVKTFEEEWPDGAHITEENILKAYELGLDLHWFAESFLDSPHMDAYDKAMALHRDAYEKALAPHMDAYDKAMALHMDAYKKAMALSLCQIAHRKEGSDDDKRRG